MTEDREKWFIGNERKNMKLSKKFLGNLKLWVKICEIQRFSLKLKQDSRNSKNFGLVIKGGVERMVKREK